MDGKNEEKRRNCFVFTNHCLDFLERRQMWVTPRGRDCLNKTLWHSDIDNCWLIILTSNGVKWISWYFQSQRGYLEWFILDGVDGVEWEVEQIIVPREAVGGDIVHSVVEEQKDCSINKQARPPNVCEGTVFNYYTVACQLQSSAGNLLQVNNCKCL